MSDVILNIPEPVVIKKKAEPAASSIHDLFAAQAARTPHAIAAEYAGHQLTYRTLKDAAGRFASILASHGVGRERIVGIGLQRSLDLPIALLGTLMAGGACMPLDAEYPPERLAYMMEDAGVDVILSDGRIPNSAPGEKPCVVSLNQRLLAQILADGSRIHSASRAQDAAWIVYTSGSTGRPRGVVLTHGGLVNHHLAAIQLYGLTPRDRVLQFSSLSFDISIEEMLPSWLAGATVVYRDPEMPLLPAEFVAWIEKKKITVLDLPTAYWHELVHGLAKTKQRLPESLRLVIVGGEKASASALHAWSEISRGKVRWINTYGPSEASIIATSWEPRLGEQVSETELPIGRPIANTHIHLLDENLKPVETGATGEIYIGGAGIARGYVNRPLQSADKFIQDPFSNSGATLYKTGDLGRLRPDGNLEFRGRTDHQVKIQGYRVELGEIESALERHPGVRQCAAALLDDETKVLLAWIVPSESECPTASELREFLAQALPNYMIPSAFHAIPSMPLTPNGKVDRRALMQMKNPMPADRPAGVARDEMDSKVIGIMEKVLQVQPIGIHDSFFDLGGNSLLAIRLMSAIEEAFSRSFPLARLLESSTPAQIADLLRAKKETPVSTLVPVQPLGTERPLFLVHGMGGHVLRFRDLVRHFAPDQPVFALQAQGLSGEAPCLNRVDDMANLYVKEIRQAQPKGPYAIAGYSFGGFVAVEIARRLAAEGQEVEYLALIDTFAVPGGRTSSLVKSFLRLPAPEKASYISRKITKKVRRMVKGVALPAAVKAVREGCLEAERHYQPQIFEGKISLFLPSNRSLRNSRAEDGGWGAFATKGVVAYQIPGDHGSIVDEPNAKDLARLICSGLERVRTSRSLLAAAATTR